jgi:hypothetical protein
MLEKPEEKKLPIPLPYEEEEEVEDESEKEHIVVEDVVVEEEIPEAELEEKPEEMIFLRRKQRRKVKLRPTAVIDSHIYGAIYFREASSVAAALDSTNCIFGIAMEV